MTPAAALRRRVPAAPWQMAAEPVLPPEGELQPPDPLTVLESDALLGALFMGLLPALAADLASPHTALRAAALDILFAVVANGPEACLSLLACTPLLQALRRMMVIGAGLPPPATSRPPEVLPDEHEGFDRSVHAVLNCHTRPSAAVAPLARGICMPRTLTVCY